MTSSHGQTARMATAGWDVVELPWPDDVVSAVRAWSGDGDVTWLDSPISDAPGWSLIAVDPCAVLDQPAGAPARLAAGSSALDHDASLWALWQRSVARLGTWPALDAGLAPGWVGYVGFGAARLLERLPGRHSDDLGFPLARLALHDRVVLLDGATRRAWLVSAPDVRARLGLPPAEAAPAAVERWTAAALPGGAGVSPAVAPSTPQPVPVQSALLGGAGVSPAAPRLVLEQSRTAYEQRVARALEYIAAGDIYQVNVCQRLRLEGLGDPLAAAAALRTHNPAAYAALLRWGEHAVLSASPELFLRVRGDEVLTSPIKGTRPRGADAAQDAAWRAELLESAKDRAELAMIIDLHRNDLGRVCRYGSVRVAAPRRLEALPRVFHTVADVVGRLAPGRTALDALMAAFPAGSISGVPKIRALEIIDELEPVARGVYTGAIGVLALDGRATFNVAIRIIQARGATAVLHVGGGIVADSDPAAEYAETLAKARGLLEALGVAAPGG